MVCNCAVRFVFLLFMIFIHDVNFREGAYTCWPQNVGGEDFNYGTRIDHIFIAGPCLHQNCDGEGHSFFSCHVSECDILVQFKRGKDNMSR